MNRPDARTALARRLRDLRFASGLTRHYLAKVSGVAPIYYNRLERGSQAPTIDTLNRICNGFGITLAEFFRPLAVTYADRRRPRPRKP